MYDLYATDDWRVRPELTINAGIRWEYGAPITELYGRIVNLDIAPGFICRSTRSSAVIPKGPDLSTISIQLRLYVRTNLGSSREIGLSWRPIPGSSVVVRAGIRYLRRHLGLPEHSPADGPTGTSLYQRECAIKPCLPQTLASGFNPCSSITPYLFAVNPNFRVGYAQTWQLSVQRDCPRPCR